VANGGSAAPAALGGGEQAGEIQWEVGKLAAGSVGGEEGRKRGLCVELEAVATMVGPEVFLGTGESSGLALGEGKSGEGRWESIPTVG
jgi:hypothetical protein